LLLGLLHGASVLHVVLVVFRIALYRQQGAREARALAVTTLIVADLGLIFINRSWTRTLAKSLCTPNAAARWVYGGGVALLLLVLYLPSLRELFHFSALHLGDLEI
jgi:Ca2+-transporting ATPase